MRPRPDDAILRGICLLLTDVDGVLTDGRVHFDAAGQELKTFHVHDGAGLVFWNRCGLLSGFLSGRGGRVVEARARELGVHELHLGRLDKRPAFEEILERRKLEPHQVAFVGDDITDLPVLELAAFAVAVANARPELVARAHHVTTARGGEGALREVIELLLKAQGRWSAIVDRGGLP